MNIKRSGYLAGVLSIAALLANWIGVILGYRGDLLPSLADYAGAIGIGLMVVGVLGSIYAANKLARRWLTPGLLNVATVSLVWFLSNHR
jgi:hypothetical protein